MISHHETFILKVAILLARDRIFFSRTEVKISEWTLCWSLYRFVLERMLRQDDRSLGARSQDKRKKILLWSGKGCFHLGTWTGQRRKMDFSFSVKKNDVDRGYLSPQSLS